MFCCLFSGLCSSSSTSAQCTSEKKVLLLIVACALNCKMPNTGVVEWVLIIYSLTLCTQPTVNTAVELVED